MNHQITSDIISQRHCKRQYLDTSIPKDTINAILQNAGNAGSSKNSQPWQVAIVTGNTQHQLIKAMCSQFDQNQFESPDYVYMTDPMPEVFKQRARECGYALYDLKGISKNDSAKRQAHFRENYTFFNAPMAFIFHLHANAERGNFLDMGLFMQNVMLGLSEQGLGSCPQFSICSYSNTVKTILNIESERIIVCGMSVGYPDESATVNTFVPNRIPLNQYIKWYE